MQFGLLISLLFGVIAFAYGGPSEGKKNTRNPMMCAGKNLTITEAMKKIGRNCWEKHNGKSEDSKKTKEEKHSNMLCFKVCESQGNGLISTDGKILKDKISEYVKQVYPETVTAALNKAFTACVDEHGSKAVMKDGKCDSYEALFKCVDTASIKACKTSKM